MNHAFSMTTSNEDSDLAQKTTQRAASNPSQRQNLNKT